MQHFLLYIDPGSGSYLIQMIIAGVLGVAFFFKNIMFAVKHFFQRIFGKKS
jgi:ATP-dependent Zn protease